MQTARGRQGQHRAPGRPRAGLRHRAGGPGRPARPKAGDLAEAARRLDLYAEEGDGPWSGEKAASGGYAFSRVKRGVVRADRARRPAAARRRRPAPGRTRRPRWPTTFSGVATFTPQGQDRHRARAARPVQRGDGGRPPRPVDPALQGPGRDEPRAAVGDHPGRRGPHPAAGAG